MFQSHLLLLGTKTPTLEIYIQVFKLEEETLSYRLDFIVLSSQEIHSRWGPSSTGGIAWKGCEIKTYLCTDLDVSDRSKVFQRPWNVSFI